MRRVLTGDGYAQVGLRPDLVQVGMLQKLGILCFYDQVIGLDIGRKGYCSIDLGHMGFDVRSLISPGHRYPVITIAHKVGPANLVDTDGGEAIQVGGFLLDPCPALLVFVLQRQKGAAKVGITPYAADDGVEGDVSQPHTPAGSGLQLLADLFIRKKIG